MKKQPEASRVINEAHVGSMRDFEACVHAIGNGFGFEYMKAEVYTGREDEEDEDDNKLLLVIPSPAWARWKKVHPVYVFKCDYGDEDTILDQCADAMLRGRQSRHPQQSWTRFLQFMNGA